MRCFPEEIIREINTNPDCSTKGVPGNFGNDVGRIASLVAGKQEYRDYIGQLTAKELFDVDLDVVVKITTTEADPVHSIIAELKDWNTLTIEAKKAAVTELLSNEEVLNKIFPVSGDDKNSEKKKDFFERLGRSWLQKNYPAMNSQQATQVINSYNQQLSSLDNTLLEKYSKDFFTKMMAFLPTVDFKVTPLFEEKVVFGMEHEANAPTFTSTIQVYFQSIGGEKKIPIAETQYHYKLGENGFDLVSAGCDEPLFYSLLTGENEAAQQPENAPAILLQLMRKGYYRTAKTESEKLETAKKIKELEDRFNKTGELKIISSRAEVLRLVRSGEGLSSLQYANLQDINLSNVSFIRVKSGKNTSLKNGDIEAAVDFTGSDLRGVNFAGADLRCVNFTSALIDEKTNFSGAIINKETDFTGVKLTADQILQLLGFDKLFSEEDISKPKYNLIISQFDQTLEAILKSTDLSSEFKQKIIKLKEKMNHTLEWRKAPDDKNPRLFSLAKPVFLLKIDEKNNKESEVNLKAAFDEWKEIRKSFNNQSEPVVSTAPQP